jgi:hypothetical protein
LSQQCTTGFGPGQIQVVVQGLVEGVATIEVEEMENCEPVSHTEIFDRVIEGGPTGVTAANFAGIYWRTGQDPPDPEAGAMVVAFLGNNTFALLEEDFADLEAGTYTAAGGMLSVHPVYSNHGEQVDQEFAYVVSGNTLTIQQGEESLVFQRCSGTSGSGLQGVWTAFNEVEQVITQVVIGTTEYAVMNVGMVVNMTTPAAGANAGTTLRTWHSFEDRMLLARLGLLGTR